MLSLGCNCEHVLTGNSACAFQPVLYSTQLCLRLSAGAASVLLKASGVCLVAEHQGRLEALGLPWHVNPYCPPCCRC